MLFRRNDRRVYAYRVPVDMRKSFDGLIAVTRDQLKEDPLDGSVYVFTNRSGSLIKCLVWDRTGFVFIAKRLDRGRFRIPGNEDKREINERNLELIFDGIVLGTPRI